MKYDFNKVIDRKNTNSIKWDIKEGELPLWVADMDFETAPCVKEAIQKRAAHGIYGYSDTSEEWAKSYQYWWKTRHDFEVERDWLVFVTGVIPALSTCVRKLTSPAEKILVQTPCYNHFFSSIVNNGRYPVECPLSYDEETGRYSMNFDVLEEKLSDPQVSLMILCNPQNPTGNIWSKEELAKVGELCEKNGVTVLSDEIHCDIARPGMKYVPFASVSETCRRISVTCVAPTKCFNIAGINSAAVIVPDRGLRHKVWRALNTDEVAEPNVFAVDATVAAFTHGGDWLDELNAYLFENRKYAEDFIGKELPGLSVVKGDATYLLWVNVHQDGHEFTKNLRKETGLWLNEGNVYGKTGETFVRINLACPRSVLEEALGRLKAFCGRK